MAKHKYKADGIMPIRADKFLSQMGAFKSRSQAKEAIVAGKVSVNNFTIKSSTIIFSGDEVEVDISNSDSDTVPNNIVSYECLYEDDDILVINKPAGVLVHRTQSGKDFALVDVLSQNHKLSQGYSPDRPGIVHRLDRDTSGLLIVAKSNLAQDFLYQQFRKKEVNRFYLAVTYRKIDTGEGTISSYLVRHPTFRTKRISLRDPITKKILRPNLAYQNTQYIKDQAGRLAITHYRFLKSGLNGVSLVQLKLDTGRTHQIRVHLSESGAPIIGDRLYSNPNLANHFDKPIRDFIKDFSRCALHAFRLEFIHPVSKSKMEFCLPLPSDILELLKRSEISYDP